MSRQGNKLLVAFGLPPGSGTSDKGKEYQNPLIEISHLLEPRWKDTP